MLRYLMPLVISLALLHGLPESRHAWRSRTLTGWSPQQDTRSPAASHQREKAYRANNIGVAQLEQFDYTSAEASFREALKIQPDLAIARLNLGLALLYSGRFADAIDEARHAVKLMPETPQAHFALGLAARADNLLEEAIAAFSRVLQLDPDDTGARVHLAQIHLQERRYQEALSFAQEALAAEPYNVTAAYTVALALTRARQTEEGQRAMQRFETLRDSAYGVTYSQIYLGQGRYGEAMASTGAEADLVDPAPPPVTFSDSTEEVLPSPSPQAAASPGAGGITLFDADGNGRLDLLATGAGPLRFFRNDDGRLVEDATRLAGVRLENTLRAVAGDYDNDGRPDLFVLLQDGYALLRQTDTGAFEDVTSRALPPAPGPAVAAAFADVDHDGDLDIIAAGASVQLLRNNGDGTFTDISAEAGVRVPVERAVGIAAVDFDNRRDVDILVAAGERAPMLLLNMRDGTFSEPPAETGLPPAARYSALAVADVDKDGYTDVFLATADEPGVLALSDGRGGFRTVAAPDATRGAIAAQFVDYDNDGLLDLITLSESEAHLFRNVGGGQWMPVTEHAGLGALKPGASRFQALAVGDLDNNGSRDLVVRLADGALRVWTSQPAPHPSLRARLAGTVSNRSGIGARVEIRAGSLRQMLDATSSTPAVAPADLLFGLGPRETADVVRVLWPSGILQAETELDMPVTRTETIEVTELDRKPSSCPYLFTWNGERFEFVTDIMGGGETGAWLAPGVWNVPDPDEYVRIRGDQLRPRDGRYELRVTNELEEALFLDRVQLLAIDHAGDVEVYPNEGLRSPPRPAFTVRPVREARPPVHAVDGHGRDLLSRISTLDRQYADTFGLVEIRGYAEPHDLILDLGATPDNAVLLMTGWTDYAFSNDNVAASQRGLVMSPPSLQVRDEQGAWRTVIDEIGFPVGRPQTVLVDLAGRFLSPAREVRIRTNMRIYWDQILVAVPDTAAVKVTRLDPLAATLRWRGFSEEVTPDGREPYGYDYHRVSAFSPWKVMVGRYTREGDVRPLLRQVDDMFVISQPGDEIALSFRALPPAAAGHARTYLLYVHGYSKEMNPRSATPDTVGPLPFRAMSGYPYREDEHYPRTRAHREYQQRYNTRVVHRAVPSIDATVLGSTAEVGPPASADPARR